MSLARRVHVTCGANKKVFTLSDTTSITEQLCRGFKVTGAVVLQIWDEEFMDFVNIESETDIHDKSKLNLSIVTEAVGVQNHVQNMLTPSDAQSVSNVTNSATPLRATPGSNQSAPAGSGASTPSSTVRWPLCMEVPVHLFSPDLKKVLESGCSIIDMKPKYKKQLQEAFFYDMSQYGFYPPVHKYKDAAVSLVTMFPSLRDTDVHSEGYECWAHSISEKFRNERRNITDIPEVAIRKKKRKFSEEVEEPKNVYGLPKFLPSRPDGEDDETIRAHVTWMQAEAVKSVQNKNKIVRLMDATFADRRAKIINQKSTMDELKDMYPLLFTAEEIRAEYCRLSGRELDSIAFCTAFGEVTSVVFSDANTRHRKKTDVITEALKASKSIASEDEKKAFLCVKLLHGIAFMLKEDVQFIFVEEGKIPVDCGTPIIVYSGDIREPSACLFKIDVGGMEVCEPVDFFDAVDCLLCCYYSFNFVYAKKAPGTLVFLQTFIKKHKDSVPLSRNVCALKQRLKLA